jgi:hypothetical protein
VKDNPPKNPPGTPVGATIHYELRIQPGPWKIRMAHETYEIPARGDVSCIVRQVKSGGQIISEEIAAVLTSTSEFLTLRQFIAGGGTVGLHRDIAP